MPGKRYHPQCRASGNHESNSSTFFFFTPSRSCKTRIMDLTTILLAVIFLTLLLRLYSWLFNSWDHWTSRGIPSVPGVLPIVGNVWPVIRLRENFSVFCTSIYRAHRGRSMVGFYNLKNPVLMVREPELVKTVLQTSFQNFQHNDVMLDPEIDPLMALDPFFVRGPEWKESRSTFVSTLSATRIKSMTQAVVTVCEKLERHLAAKIPRGNKVTSVGDHLDLDAKFLFSRFTTEVAAAVVLSIEGNSFADDYKGTLLDSMKVTMDPTATKALKSNLIFFCPALSRFLKSYLVPPEVDRYFRRLVNDLEEMRKKNGTPGNDVLQVMLDLEKSGKIPRIEALAHAFSFFLESYETSSLGLSFVSYFLAKHQDVQDRLRREIEKILASHEGRLTYEAVNEMSYMDQVIKESMRIFPAAGVLTKSCAEAFRLEGSDGLTLDVTPGSSIVVPILGLHRDPEIWENPERFDPERFAKGAADGRHKFAYIPFGEGPRACPGQRFAGIQMKAALATIVRNYRVESSPKMREPVVIDPSYHMLRPIGGVWIRLRPL